MEKTVNERITKLRTSLNLTQQEFAQKIGISQVGVWRIENNEVVPRKTTVMAISNALNVNSEWLLNGSGDMFLEKLIVQDQNPWRDALVQQLSEEVQFLRTLVNNLSKSKSGSFLNGIAPVGFFGNEKLCNTVRVS